MNEFGAFSGYNSTTPSGQLEYVFGFFGCVSNATISGLNFTAVDIDGVTPVKYSGKNLIGDTIGACIGFSCENLTLSNITVSGSIKGTDSIGGIVGRAYGYNQSNGNNGDYSVTKSFSITDCVNNATIYGHRDGEVNKAYSKVGGIIGYARLQPKNSDAEIKIERCTNTGNITVDSPDGVRQYIGAICTTMGNPFGVTDTCSNSGVLTFNKHNAQYPNTYEDPAHPDRIYTATGDKLLFNTSASSWVLKSANNPA